MSAKIIDGKKIAADLETRIQEETRELTANGIVPGLTVLRVGEDPASEVYVRSKERKAEALGFNGIQIHLPESVSQDELAAEIDRLNADDEVDGILLQLPLPDRLDAKALLDRIDPDKDVDGFHPVNVGRLLQGRPCLVPCTPAGVIHMIETCNIEGKRSERRRGRSKRHRRQADRGSPSSSPRHSHDRAFPNKEYRRRCQAGGHRYCRRRPTAPRNRRHDQARSGCTRRRHQSHRRDL